ncbi:MAG TPA: NUDIX hydrolase [Chloroflexi bacterium]|nr:NUDIX hydrolase [Chloroflexota bacterium]
MQPWKTLSRRTKLDHSPYLIVEEHTIELPDGHVIPNWTWVITPDYINVLAVTENQRFLCFRQTKYGVEGTSLAPVGGYLEPGEDPLETAQRELLEETGYQAAEWILLGDYVVDGNRGAGAAHIFLARGAQHVAEPDADDLEEQELLLLSRADIEAALAAGAFKSLPWASTVALALLHLDREDRRADE